MRKIIIGLVPILAICAFRSAPLYTAAGKTTGKTTGNTASNTASGTAGNLSAGTDRQDQAGAKIDTLKKDDKRHGIDSLMAIGESYYRVRDKKCINYFMKAYLAGDTSRKLAKLIRAAGNGIWQMDIPRTSNTVDSLRNLVEAHPDSLLPLRQYIFLLGNDNDTVLRQVDAWMKRFPGSTAIPFALGESYYGEESPKAQAYLLKVAEMEPKNAKTWEMLSIDAERWGNDAKDREYLGKAVAARPDDPYYAFLYANSFEKSDTAVWRKKIWELTKTFPGDDKGAQGLYWLAHQTPYMAERQRVLEQLRILYNPATFNSSLTGMADLYDLYLQEGAVDKAIELAAAMGNLNGFGEKLKLAQNIAAVRELTKVKKYDDASQLLRGLKAPLYSHSAITVDLLKAEVIDAAGSPQAAYDSLLLIQAKTPDDAITEAMVRYGAKIGKPAAAIQQDLASIRNKNARPAPAFELGLYTSDARARLEDYRGKAILLTFWFPGCGPCRLEMPHFQNVVNKYSKKNLAYLGINVLPQQDDYVLPFMIGTGYSFTPLRGNPAWAEKTFHVHSSPSNFLIDRRGRILYSGFLIDGSNERMLELMINSALEE